MDKYIKFFLILLLINGCSYQPMLLEKEYDFRFNKINIMGERKVNDIIKNNLSKRASGSKYLNILIKTFKEKETISYNAKGDPKIFKIILTVEYSVERNENVLFSNKLIRETTYNNINDKFQLLEFEDDKLKNLAESISKEIIITIGNFDL